MPSNFQVRIKAIVPKKGIPYRQIRDAIDKGLRDAAADVKKDFEETVRSWSSAGFDGGKSPGGLPSFVIKGPDTRGGGRSIRIYTRHKVYYWLNFGTSQHTIQARNAKALRFKDGRYYARTRRGWIGSGPAGRSGHTVFRGAVNHPGSEARQWDETIAKEQKRAIETHVNNAIRTAANK